ncbi:MAG: DnaJ C-terminal domain-containing protein [Alphaproteobacteria bacterium]
MRDPYNVLGVPRTASQDEVKAAYRKLAKKLHPDLNPGDAEVELKFKEVSTAYDLLSDPDRRARFDRGEIDAAGNERSDQSFWRSYAESGPGAKYEAHGGGFDPSELFSELFGERVRNTGGGRARMRRRGADVSMRLAVDFVTATLGGSRRVTLPSGRSIDMRIPVGAATGQVLRLAGQGMEGAGGGAPGDVLVELEVTPHPWFRREGFDVHAEVPITLPEAVMGARVTVPTIDGRVSLTVPAGSNSGDTLRLRGRGIHDNAKGVRGDQFVRLKVVLPERPDAELRAFVEEWAKTHPYDVRAKAGMD